MSTTCPASSVQICTRIHALFACGHTFCEGCLTKYTMTQQNAIHGNTQLVSIVIPKEEIDAESTPTSLDTIDITAETDKTTFDPVDVKILDVNGIETVVVTDYNNKSLKSYYLKDYQPHHSKLELSMTPRTVAKLDQNQVAVSFTADNRIVIAKVTPDLVLVSSITTEKKYDCLSSLNDSTRVAGCDGVLHIVGMTGDVLKSLRPGINMSPNPNFLCTTHIGNILVSDYMSAYCLTPAGTVGLNYTPSGDRGLGSPQGISVSKTGDIFVADGDQNRVVQLTPSGEFVRDILTLKDGIKNPCFICLHGHKLYVTQKQQLKVFRLNTGN